MNNKEFIAALAARTGYTQDESQKMAKTVVDMMGKSFETGDPVPVIGFGTFEVKKRLERVMVNPSTGLRMLVPPKLVLKLQTCCNNQRTCKKGRTRQWLRLQYN